MLEFRQTVQVEKVAAPQVTREATVILADDVCIMLRYADGDNDLARFDPTTKLDFTRTLRIRE